VTTLLQAEGLVVAHGAMHALDGVDLTLDAGEILGVLGPNGSGKSTLLRVLLGAQRPDAGVVWLHGAALALMPARTRARTLTMVAHTRPPDFALTVRDVVGLGRIPHEGFLGAPRPRDAEIVARALAQTDITALADRSVATLSSGELQRVHLARAFAQEARLLLLDEPTANLDPLHQLTAMRMLRGFAGQGGAAIVVLHDLTLAARTCDRLLVLERGRVRAQGPAGVALSEALLADVFHVRARIDRDGEGRIDHVLAIEPTMDPSVDTAHAQGGPS
jgi:iron complex transport system ATP-binding protein